MVFSYGGYDQKSIGLLGSCLYFIYFIICISRSFILWRDEEDLQPKVIFHLVLTSNSIFEFIYFLAMLFLDRTGLIGYTSHLLGLLTNVMAFSIVIYMWTSIISYKRDITRSKYILSVFLLLNIGCTIAGIVDLCIIGNYDEYLSKSKAYETIVIVNSLSLLILCIGMLIYGTILKIRLDLSLHDLLLRGSQIIIENTKRIYLLRRIIIILGICTTCFLLRVVCLVLVLYDVTGGHHLTDSIPLVLWYTLSQWIPNFGAGYTLLYILRTKLENRARISNVPTTQQRQFQQSMSNTSFRPSTQFDDDNTSLRMESKISNISPIFITTKSDEISHGDESGSSGLAGEGTRNTLHGRYDQWSGEWVETTEGCFPPND